MNLDPKDLSLSDCVELTGKSASTIRRQKQKLIELGATCSPKGWHVTIEQLAAVGLASRITPGSVSSGTPETVPDDTSKQLIETLQKQIDLLEKTLERERIRADKAEIRLERLLPAHPTPQKTTAHLPAQEVPQEEHQESKGFFRKLFNI